MQGQIRITEQGETISGKYSNAEVGRQQPGNPGRRDAGGDAASAATGAPREDYLATMEELSAHAFGAYRDLVYETEGFENYFWESTVITEIASLNIGSRPSSRKKTREHRGPARDSLGVQLGAMPADAAGLVRVRLGDRGLDCGASGATAWRS